MGNEVRKTMNLKNRTSCLFKIVLFVIFSIFVAEIIVLPKIEHDMLKEAGRQELVTVQQLCGAVLEKNPDVEQDFILDCVSLQNLGRKKANRF